MKIFVLKRAFVLMLISLFTMTVRSQEVARQPNIILMIGDGMGVTQVYAGFTANYGILNIEQFKSIGFSKTHSASNYNTDSAAGGTAISSGKKTYNSAVGVDTDTLPVKTILEYAEENGLATGMVTTSSITDATPASFIAHQPNRYNLDQIAEDFLKTDIDVFIGGGKINFAARRDSMDLIREFLDNGYQVNLTKDSMRNMTMVRVSTPEGGRGPRFNTGRGDDRDLIKELRDKGYQVMFSMDSIKNVTTGKLAGLTAMDHNPSFNAGRGDMLPIATETAINILANNKKGFFLMVEGAHIDKQAHTRNTDDIVKEMIDFDKAIGIALDFARKDGNTLVVVTADHETAGMHIVNGSFETGEVTAQYNERGGHTGVMVPVFAFGPGAESFQGIQENTDLFYKMMAVLGITPNDSE